MADYRAKGSNRDEAVLPDNCACFSRHVGIGGAYQPSAVRYGEGWRCYYAFGACHLPFRPAAGYNRYAAGNGAHQSADAEYAYRYCSQAGCRLSADECGIRYCRRSVGNEHKLWRDGAVEYYSVV